MQETVRKAYEDHSDRILIQYYIHLKKKHEILSEPGFRNFIQISSIGIRLVLISKFIEISGELPNPLNESRDAWLKNLLVPAVSFLDLLLVLKFSSPLNF